MPVAERQRETGADGQHLRWSPRITGRIRALPGPERVLTWVRWACEDSMTINAGTEGQVGHRGDTIIRGGHRPGRHRHHRERTGGRLHRLAVDRLAGRGGRSTAAEAADLHGIAGR